MIQESAEVKEGPWRQLETLVLIACREVLESRSLPITSVNCAMLYRFVAGSQNVNEMQLPISTKSSARVAAKVADLRNHET